ncbi:MAG: hypothetical protein M1822_000686 [Bathelium mastoideum]|nr:MAG: hypothetical protein M1822_000686 [Bathelium mastoideum]
MANFNNPLPEFSTLKLEPAHEPVPCQNFAQRRENALHRVHMCQDRDQASGDRSMAGKEKHQANDHTGSAAPARRFERPSKRLSARARRPMDMAGRKLPKQQKVKLRASDLVRIKEGIIKRRGDINLREIPNEEWRAEVKKMHDGAPGKKLIDCCYELLFKRLQVSSKGAAKRDATGTSLQESMSAMRLD